MNKGLTRKIIVFLIGAFVYAAGVIIVKNCYLGISPITSVPYVMSLETGQTLGACTMYFNFVFYLIQKLVLKKEYTLTRFLTQLILSAVFAVLIDAAGVLIGWFVPQLYPGRLLYLVFGCFVLAIGMTGVVLSDFGVLPAEGAVLCISRITKWEFGICKVLMDVVCVMAAAVLSLVFLGKVEGVREGTLISAFLIGTFAKSIGQYMREKVAKYLHSDDN